MYTSISHRSRLASVLLQSVPIELPCDICLHINAVTSLHLLEITGAALSCSSSSSSTASSVVDSISSLGGEWSAEGCTMVSVLESVVVSSPVASSLLSSYCLLFLFLLYIVYQKKLK